jgi:hypothetical protein
MNILKKSKKQGLEQMSKTGPKKREKRSVCNISIERDPQNTKPRKPRNR